MHIYLPDLNVLLSIVRLSLRHLVVNLRGEKRTREKLVFQASPVICRGSQEKELTKAVDWGAVIICKREKLFRAREAGRGQSW